MKTEQIKISKKYDSENDNIIVNVKISEQIKNELKKFCVVELPTCIYNVGNTERIRHKIKRVIADNYDFNSNKGLLADVELLRDGEVNIILSNISELEYIIDVFRRDFKNVLQDINRIMTEKSIVINMTIDEV